MIASLFLVVPINSHPQKNLGEMKISEAFHYKNHKIWTPSFILENLNLKKKSQFSVIFYEYLDFYLK